MFIVFFQKDFRTHVREKIVYDREQKEEIFSFGFPTYMYVVNILGVLTKHLFAAPQPPIGPEMIFPTYVRTWAGGCRAKGFFILGLFFYVRT